jgi:hypothetical protein
MRFFISARLKDNKPLYYMVIFFLFLSLIFWLSSWLYFYSKYGFSYETLYKYFFQDPESPERISLAQLSEELHIQTFLNAFYLLTIFALFILTSLPSSVKAFALLLGFLSCASYLYSDLLILYISPTFAYLKLFSFIGFQLINLFVILYTLLALLTSREDRYTDINLLKLLMFFFSLLLMGFFFTNLLAFYSKMGFSLGSVKEYYLGNPEKFLKPKTFEGMFKVFYPHLISMALLSVAVGHFLIFAGSSLSIPLGIGLFLFSFLGNLSGFLIRFLHPDFALLKLLSFIVLQGIILYSTLFMLIRSKPWA